MARFGLPDDVVACLFDLDGVITKTATVHAAAWKEMFDEFLAAYAHKQGATYGEKDTPYAPFDSHDDYDRYVDGKPRLDGTRDFLQARGIHLPEGDDADKPGTFTVTGLANRKNDIVLAKIRRDGVETYPDAVDYLNTVRDGGMKTAVVSSSANTLDVLKVTGLADHFDVRIDGVVARQQHLNGKPAPDTFLAAATKLGLRPDQAAVFEDALAGVEAGRAGNFGRVVGVDRVGGTQAHGLKQHGADVVVQQITELLQ